MHTDATGLEKVGIPFPQPLRSCTHTRVHREVCTRVVTAPSANATVIITWLLITGKGDRGGWGGQAPLLQLARKAAV